MKDREKVKLIIGGNFNIKTEERGGIGIEEENMKRSSKDKITSNEGQNFIEWL